MEKFKQYFSNAKTYVSERSDLFVGIGVVAGLLAIVGVVVLVNELSGPQIVYQPVKACDVFTPAEAQSLLGEKINNTEKNNPQISGNFAVSKCGYSDLNSQAMRVAAVTIRTGINDEGVAKNKADFATAQATNSNEDVASLGDSAFFNAIAGQLNVLKAGNWYIFSYGVGDSPEQNTLDDALLLARKVLA